MVTLVLAEEEAPKIVRDCGRKRVNARAGILVRSRKSAGRCAIAKAENGAGNRTVRIGRACGAHADRGGRISCARRG